MIFKGFRVKIVIMVFIIGLGIFMIGQYFNHQKRVIEPIYHTFSSIEAVDEVMVEERDSQILVVLSFKNRDQLEKDIRQVLLTANQISLPIEILVQDNANDRLEEVYHQMHFAVEQAVSNGDFIDLEDRIKQIAAENRVQSRLTVDREYICLQLHEGKNYLYQIISREQEPIIKRFTG